MPSGRLDKSRILDTISITDRTSASYWGSMGIDLLLLVGSLSLKLADADWAAAPEEQMNPIGLRRMVHWLVSI